MEQGSIIQYLCSISFVSTYDLRWFSFNLFLKYPVTKLMFACTVLFEDKCLAKLTLNHFLCNLILIFYCFPWWSSSLIYSWSLSISLALLWQFFKDISVLGHFWIVYRCLSYSHESVFFLALYAECFHNESHMVAMVLSPVLNFVSFLSV
jgi:hypothetical protein